MTSSAPITRPRILTSIKGKQFGLDYYGFEVSNENQVNAFTSGSTGTNMLPGGVITITDLSSATYQMLPPIPGISVFIQRLSSSTASTSQVKVQMTGSTNVTIVTSSQTTAQTIAFTGSGNMWLLGLSTAVWAASVSTGSNGVTLT